tara:strand:+ start:739 stop:942 length:204 start_codon:yes stop_codon:yes gene_type:complete
MIIFENELPMDHQKSIQSIVNQWAVDIYLYDEGTGRFFANQDYYHECAWNSIEEHLNSEGLKMIEIN